MSKIIEELFNGNLEPQELTTEITPKLKKKLNELVNKEEEQSSKLFEEEKEMFAINAEKCLSNGSTPVLALK